MVQSNGMSELCSVGHFHLWRHFLFIPLLPALLPLCLSAVANRAERVLGIVRENVVLGQWYIARWTFAILFGVCLCGFSNWLLPLL